MDREELIRLAQKAYVNSVAGLSNFKVGAVLVTTSGQVYSGCNIESTTSLGVCAERVVLLKALSSGERSFKEIVICAESGEFCSPCGACRQVLWEYAPEIQVIMANGKGEVIIRSIKELLPLAFDRKNLNNHVEV